MKWASLPLQILAAVLTDGALHRARPLGNYAKSKHIRQDETIACGQQSASVPEWRSQLETSNRKGDHHIGGKQWTLIMKLCIIVPEPIELPRFPPMYPGVDQDIQCHCRTFAYIQYERLGLYIDLRTNVDCTNSIPLASSLRVNLYGRWKRD